MLTHAALTAQCIHSRSLTLRRVNNPISSCTSAGESTWMCSLLLITFLTKRSICNIRFQFPKFDISNKSKI